MAMDMEIDLTRPQPQQTQDSDTDTPPRNTLPTRLHHARNPHAPCVSYKECMKNHAASIGGHALDGCCEFMPGPTFNPLDPTSLKCGACGCHRNFHRRDPDDPTPLNHVPTPARVPHSPPSASQLLLSLSHSPSGPSDEVNPMGTGTVTGSGHGNNGNFSTSSRKRFRTKFSQEQKEKMYEFSERIGWKLKKGEEKLVEDFVKEIGVGRSVFKVWMHNNKHNSTSIIKLQDNNHNKVINKVEDINNIHVVNYLHGSSNSSNNNNGSKTSNAVVSSNNVGNCGASSVFDNNHNHRQFNFGNGGGQQEAAQAQ